MAFPVTQINEPSDAGGTTCQAGSLLVGFRTGGVVMTGIPEFRVGITVGDGTVAKLSNPTIINLSTLGAL